jgi:hypothetical protein
LKFPGEKFAVKLREGFRFVGGNFEMHDAIVTHDCSLGDVNGILTAATSRLAASNAKLVKFLAQRRSKIKHYFSDRPRAAFHHLRVDRGVRR